MLISGSKGGDVPGFEDEKDVNDNSDEKYTSNRIGAELGFR